MKKRFEEPKEFRWASGSLCYVRSHAALKIRAESKGFYPNGALMFDYPMHARRLHGVGMVYYPDGKNKRQEPYNRGQLDGVVLEWAHNGMLIKKSAYEADHKHGLFIEWDDQGKFKCQSLFLADQLASKDLNDSIERTPINAGHVMAAQNAEIRRIFLQELGYERFLAQAPYEVIHKDGPQALVRIGSSLPDEEPIALVKVCCPSTGAFYVLRVPPEMQTVREAVAWTFGLSESEYQPTQEA
ncbi:MAG: hypothetical protein HQL19_00900 [Candidatus Omnitrophica bacterium]|nr:hypothetical protein [Candidatus Omnitrophota bacterium]